MREEEDEPILATLALETVAGVEEDRIRRCEEEEGVRASGVARSLSKAKLSTFTLLLFTLTNSIALFERSYA